MNTYVIGHIKPDLDSVVAAISFAQYLKNSGLESAKPAIIDSLNPESQFVFEKFGIDVPTIISAKDITPEDRVVLVDHNETDQRLPGLNQEQIVAIFDHHKINVNFTSPISVCILTYGSSNTVAWELFSKMNFSIDQKLASIMLCAVLSDTVGLKSSTTTDMDREAVANLSQLANISNIDELTLEIFKAKSNISTLSDEQVVLNDYKIFDFSGKKVLIGQTETVEQDVLLTNRKNGLLASLETIKQREGVDLIILAITDILKVNTKLLVGGVGEIEVVEKSFGGSVQENILDIGPKMSRKKDIAPAIENSLK